MVPTTMHDDHHCPISITAASTLTEVESSRGAQLLQHELHHGLPKAATPAAAASAAAATVERVRTTARDTTCDAH